MTYLRSIWVNKFKDAILEVVLFPLVMLDIGYLHLECYLRDRNERKNNAKKIDSEISSEAN